MSDDPQIVDFSDWQPSTKTTRKRRSAGADPERDLSDVAAARADVAAVIDSKRLDKKSLEEIAEQQIRRMANAITYGGDVMLPATLKEASDVAKIWASVASMEAARKNGKGSNLNEEDASIVAVRSELERFRAAKGKPG